MSSLKQAVALSACIIMSFQNEEGIPLVEVNEVEQAKPSYSKYLMAIFAAALLATTAYTSYEAGLSAGMKKVSPVMSLNKKDAEDGPSADYHLGLPNDADGPLTNDGAKRQIVHHGFEKYKYLNGKNMAGKFAIPGHGMAQDGEYYHNQSSFDQVAHVLEYVCP